MQRLTRCVAIQNKPKFDKVEFDFTKNLTSQVASLDSAPILPRKDVFKDVFLSEIFQPASSILK